MIITKMFLTPNPYSRPQKKLNKVTHIVIHWVGNAKSKAVSNRNYFENLKGGKTYASSHYIIGLEGEVIQCMPETEIAYHAKEANQYSLGIENCHPDWGGKFNPATYKSLIELCADICTRYKLDPMQALIRHYDVTKKVCPKYYVEHEDAWQRLKKDVASKMNFNDEELLKALNGLIDTGIKLDIKVWGNMKTMNLKYAKTMVERIGSFLGADGYKASVELLVKRGCINTRAPWDAENFKVEWCRQLILNVYHKLLR